MAIVKIKNTFEIKKLTTKGVASPREKAQRLKMVRNMANLSRETLISNDPSERVNANTYKGWELGRYGGLPINGAEYVLGIFSKEGVVCTPEWLVFEIGIGPYVIPDYKKTYKAPPKERIDYSGRRDSVSIFKELLVFRDLYKETIDFKIVDDGLAPQYNPKDYIAGIKHYKNAINELLDTDCIVQLKNGLTYARRLERGSKENTFNLVCTNTNASVGNIVQQDMELYCAAPIMRHFRPAKKIAK